MKTKSKTYPRKKLLKNNNFINNQNYTLSTKMKSLVFTNIKDLSNEFLHPNKGKIAIINLYSKNFYYLKIGFRILFLIMTFFLIYNIDKFNFKHPSSLIFFLSILLLYLLYKLILKLSFDFGVSSNYLIYKDKRYVYYKFKEKSN